MQPASGVNVITGDNAQGKTNAIESIFLCALGRSHRTAREAELIQTGRDGALVHLELMNQTGAHTIEIRLYQDARRRISIDGLPCARSAELMGHLNVVMFSPEDLSLVKGGPAERRRFMDMELAQQRPAYYVALQRYASALKQRNALLKRGDGRTLFMWDEQLSAEGARIMRARQAFVAVLGESASALHREVTGGAETLSVRYRPCVDLDVDVGVPAAEETLADLLAAHLAAGAEEDLRRGFTGTGPHRDDLLFTLNGADARVFGSQGQQRTAALSLKLCEIGLFHEQTGELPVLLLDDVLSELDESRGRLLLKNLRQCQCFLTCTGLSSLERAGLNAYKVWHCVRGEIL